MKFYASKSYKNGKYIFNLYTKKEFIFLCVVSVIAIIFLFDFSKWGDNFLWCVVMLGLSFGLTAPVGEYHNLYQAFFYLLRKLYKSQKVYIWKGVRYLNDEEK